MDIIRLLMRLAIVFLGFLQIAACAPKPALVPYDGEVAKARTILVSTSRAAETGEQLNFGSRRSDSPVFAQYQVSVPEKRSVGELRFPRKPYDPAKDFLVVGHERIENGRAFIEHVNRQMRMIPANKRNVAVFVHGFNVDFPRSVLRSAQIAEDYDLDGPMVLYSWPSAGRLTQYVHDRDSALFARERFQQTLALLAQTNARSISIVAHSMGGLVTMETLRSLSTAQDSATIRRIRIVVLAEPDIDTDLFRTQIRKLDLERMAILVVGSHTDSALRLSEWIAGGHSRIGEIENTEELLRLGVYVIDVSGSGHDGLAQHSAFTSNPELVNLIASGRLGQAIASADSGDAVAVRPLTAIGNVAIAIAHIPYNLAN